MVWVRRDIAHLNSSPEQFAHWFHIIERPMGRLHRTAGINRRPDLALPSGVLTIQHQDPAFDITERQFASRYFPLPRRAGRVDPQAFLPVYYVLALNSQLMAFDSQKNEITVRQAAGHLVAVLIEKSGVNGFDALEAGRRGVAYIGWFSSGQSLITTSWLFGAKQMALFFLLCVRRSHGGSRLGIQTGG